MNDSKHLKPLEASDFDLVREIYEDAIQSKGDAFYSAEQIKAWSSLAWMPGVLDFSLKEGIGWISIERDEKQAFALRFPPDRLALLYCRGSASRRGHGTALIKRIELDACIEGHKKLTTEASLFSQSLLLKLGWRTKAIELISIGGVFFKRYLMEKKLD